MRSPKHCWTLPVEAIQEQLGTDPDQGLTSEEATARLETHGPNALPEPKPTSALTIFLSQFASLIVWVLITAAAIAAFLGEWVDCSAILAITVLNALLGFFQEWRSVRSMEALSKMTQPHCKVLRSGELQDILAKDLVPGDLLLVEAGDQVPADARLVTAFQLKVQEAALTGESVPITKSTDALADNKLGPGDQTNMLFRATTVTYGKGTALVTATGVHTEIGKIATLLESIEERETPLQKYLDSLGHRLVYLCLLVVSFIFVVGYARGFGLYQMLMTSLSLAVAAIPEALPAVVTISLAVGMRRMAKRQALIRRLSAVETLGCTTVICTDKTGTLTENTMRVQEILVSDQRIAMTGYGYDPRGDLQVDGSIVASDAVPGLQQLLTVAAVCNNAGLRQGPKEWEVTGDPTEAALLVAAKLAGLDLSQLHQRFPTVNEFPFDSERKMMSVVVADEQQTLLFLKGAPDEVLRRSTSVLIEGRVVPLEDSRRSQLTANLEAMAGRGLRVLGVAQRSLGESPRNESAEQELCFLGLVGMYDPPREQAKQAIRQCAEAGIRPIMVTGDYKATGMAIARELDMCDDCNAMDGKGLSELSEREIEDRVEHVNVFARVTAQHKMQIIAALQKRGHVVAMTGDGVNDAPAIEKADIGVAMGITGTDVTKSVSDMIVLDDNFESIVQAVEEGRGIFDNIIKFTSYLLSCNLAEILIIFLSVFVTGHFNSHELVILAPIHLLWINLITDGLPALALAFDPLSPQAMQRPPRSTHANFLPKEWVFRLITISFIICLITTAVFELCYSSGPGQARTAAFTTLVLMELSKPLILRVPFGIGFFTNPLLTAAIGFSLLLQLAVVYIPLIQIPLKTVGLSEMHWLAIGAGVLAFWLLALPIMRRATPTS